MSANEYNENIDPKQEALSASAKATSDMEAAAAADALAALGGSSVDKTKKSKTKKCPTQPTIENLGDVTTGKNKFVSEDAKSVTATEDAKATKLKSAPATPSADRAGGSGEKKAPLFSGRTFVQIMNGEFLTKDNVVNNLPFTFFVGFLLVILIAWGYYGETITKKEVQLEKELGELNSEYFTLTADYNMQRGRREIANRLAPLGIKESQTSPKKIRVRKYIFK